MNKLSKFCIPNKNLLPSQMLFLKRVCEENGGSLSFIHKFLVVVEFNKAKVYIKINIMDNEFYVFSKKHSIMFFYSFFEMKDWLEKHLFQKE